MHTAFICPFLAAVRTVFLAVGAPRFASVVHLAAAEACCFVDIGWELTLPAFGWWLPFADKMRSSFLAVYCLASFGSGSGCSIYPCIFLLHLSMEVL